MGLIGLRCGEATAKGGGDVTRALSLMAPSSLSPARSFGASLSLLRTWSLVSV